MKIQITTAVPNVNTRIDLNPSHPNISRYIIHTVIYTFPKVLLSFWPLEKSKLSTAFLIRLNCFKL